jgi:hypothetical protein
MPAMPSVAERPPPIETAAPVAAVPFVLACASLVVVVVLDSAAEPFGTEHPYQR